VLCCGETSGLIPWASRKRAHSADVDVPAHAASSNA
jgi:hypothetical protein